MGTVVTNIIINYCISPDGFKQTTSYGIFSDGIRGRTTWSSTPCAGAESYSMWPVSSGDAPWATICGRFARTYSGRMRESSRWRTVRSETAPGGSSGQEGSEGDGPGIPEKTNGHWRAHKSHRIDSPSWHPHSARRKVKRVRRRK